MYNYQKEIDSGFVDLYKFVAQNHDGKYLLKYADKKVEAEYLSNWESDNDLEEDDQISKNLVKLVSKFLIIEELQWTITLSLKRYTTMEN